MRAYKFRSSSQIALAFDIIVNTRLFCADWNQLNDPMEGVFVYSYRSTDERDCREEFEKIIKDKKHLRVCSLSLIFDSHLLWAHYASGFDGLAIEVELPDDSPKVKKVQYRGVFGHVSSDGDLTPTEAAEQILSSKYREWEYEKEVRILQQDVWYKLARPVRRVIAGHRMSPALFEALRIVCDSRSIPLRRTGIGDEGIDADYVPPLSNKE